MNCGDDVSPPYIFRDGPYSASLASSASSSSASVWSDAASQSSDDSSAAPSEAEFVDTYCYANQLPPAPLATKTSDRPLPSTLKATAAELPAGPRVHPRRSQATASSRVAGPPALVRQCDRKVNFVDSLVDSSAQIVEAIWPLSSVACRTEMGNKGVLPLRTFIQETLRRSRTSYSTLQVALYYLILIKPHVPTHDFTMEQPDEGPSLRALQCGRRMFLAALILASKYLQDRNYSARAWSKISGLNTMEINQNEMAFLLAVDWELHITDAVFQRWTEIVLKYTPSQPPAPGASCAKHTQQVAAWKAIILTLTPALDNVEGLSPPTVMRMDALAPSIELQAPPSMIPDETPLPYGSTDSTPVPRFYTPSVMEPSPATAYVTRIAPALGLLPTPRLTPQSAGFNTPAVSVASCMLSRSAMGFAMAQATNFCAAQVTERWPPAPTASPQSYLAHRRSSLANSVCSRTSSPESMISDSSRSSRSSSISSASSLMSAPLASKLDVQARCRYAKRWGERLNRTVIAEAPEFCEDGLSSSPESYAGPVGKDFLDLSLDTPLARREVELDYFSKDEEAARALQELHNHPRSGESPSRVGAKRSRTHSIDHSLHDNVRDLLTGSFENCATSNWSDDLVRSRSGRPQEGDQVAIRATSTSSLGRKRVCCAAEAAQALPEDHLHPALGGFGGPGMWEGILN